MVFIISRQVRIPHGPINIAFVDDLLFRGPKQYDREIVVAKAQCLGIVWNECFILVFRMRSSIFRTIEQNQTGKRDLKVLQRMAFFPEKVRHNDEAYRHM